MVTVGFHASHEQLPPSALLEAVRRAEQAGFAAAMCSELLQVHLSCADDERVAEEVAHEQWRSNVFGSTLAWNLELPEQVLPELRAP